MGDFELVDESIHCSMIQAEILCDKTVRSMEKKNEMISKGKKI